MITKCTFLLLSAVLGGYADSSGACSGYPEGHTMCRPPAAAALCEGVLCEVSRKARRLIVRSHNAYRNRVASGNEKRGSPGPQPEAKNMAALKWDKELATIAQRWAEQLTWEHDCSDCRRTKSGAYAGQNMALIASSDPITEYNWRTQAIKSWYDEVEKMNGTDVAQGEFTFNYETGHYTQVVWAETTKVGCGIRASKTTCEDLGYSGFYCAIAVCNYVIGGNMKGQAIYETTGDQCNKTNKKFKSLCKPRNKN